MPAGTFEYEQWIGARLGRNATVGQQDFNLWEIRHELEYGVTDNYSLSLYLNESLTAFQQPGSGRHISHFQFDGVSLENRLMILNPVDHAIGVALYLEPRFSGSDAEIEEKIIVGQTVGDWKWALNLTHATEWSHDLHDAEGEVEVSFGLTRRLNRHWNVGIEAREHNELPDYRIWENTAFGLGPVINYTQDRWWATLTILPQIVGANFAENVDNNHNLDLEDHERVDVRLIVGFSF